jgi:hypothetical protein
MIWAGRFEELFEEIGKLPCLILQVVLSGSDMFFIRVIDLLVVVGLIATSSNDDPLGVPL